MRSWLRFAIGSVLLLASACGEDVSDFCSEAFEQNAACLSERSGEECEAAYAECPGRVLVLESCPIQFACP